jgi:hypothetical protein
MKAIYEGEWKNYTDVKDSYGKNLPPASAIVYAGYEAEGYEGSALIVWRRGRDWLENNDSHCSCDGLGYWSPEKTSAKALLMRDGGAFPGMKAAVKASMKRKRKKIALSSNSRTFGSDPKNGGANPPEAAKV